MNPRLRSLLVVLGGLLAATTDLAGANPLWLPPDESGWPGAVVDERDLAPYLAFHKIAAARGLEATVETPNQAVWDIRTYALDLRPDVPARTLYGSVEVRAEVLSGPLATMELDLSDSMRVDSVRAVGLPAVASHASNLVTVALDRPYLTGEIAAVTLHYHGKPQPTGIGHSFEFTAKYGRPQVWTLSEPFAAREWWPCKDYPYDKADSVDVAVTLPADFIVASNGVQVARTVDGDHATTRWHERHPVSTYLVSIACYAYAVGTDTYHASGGGTMPLLFYQYPEDTLASAPGVARTQDIMAAFATWYGEYPFLDEKYGQAQTTWGGGMENQTCTSLGNFSEFLISHEMAHQWWGDMVTCRDFHHIWLNEGFATYGEALWAEARDGAAAYHANMNAKRYLGDGTVYCPVETDVSRVFHYGLSYQKGAWVLHMLRHVLGDATFRAALAGYRAAHAYSTAITEDFQAACEAVSGRDLDAFFQPWIYGELYPQYRTASWARAVGDSFDVTVRIEQLQNSQLFWMPIDVRIQTAGGPLTFVAWDSLASQEFTFRVGSDPQSVALDPDGWILRSVGSVAVSDPEWPAIELSPPAPNPSRGRVDFVLTLPAAGTVRLGIYDVRGARVRPIHEGTLGAGAHAFAWDGCDERGHRLAAGVYLVRLEAPGAVRTRKLALTP